MPPEIPIESKCVCSKSQDISRGIIRLGKFSCGFGSRIAAAPFTPPSHLRNCSAFWTALTNLQRETCVAHAADPGSGLAGSETGTAMR
jgi:hypothetical protein